MEDNDAVFVPVLPSFDGFFDDLSKTAKKGGEQAGRELSSSIEKQMRSAEAGVKKTGAALERANNRAADAAGKTRVAQQKLVDVMESGTASASQLATATERYEKAQRDQESADKAATRATENHSKAQQEMQKATDHAADAAGQYEDAQKGANREAKSGTGVFDKLRQQLGLTSDEMDKTGHQAGTLGDKIKGGLKGLGTGALLGIGAQIGSSIMGGIKGGFDAGFERLASVEQAESMLGGLGHTAESTAEIMDNAMASVKGTAFGFGEAAQMAATFVGAGIPEGEELTKVLTLVGDTAAITGSDLNEMGSIWTKIATGQRLGTEEMNQLADRGLGLLPKLQEHYGVTADEARKMVTEGKVSFEDFAEIMEEMVGGSAQAMGDTFAGSASNMRAALGRLGAKFLEPVFNTAPAIFKAIGGGVDALGEALDPVIARISGFLEPILQRFADWLGPALEGAIRGVSAAFGLLGDGLGILWSWLSSIFAPGWEWVTGHISTAIETVQVAWQEITSAFQGEDWGYGALASMIGADNAQWVVDKISLIKPAWEELTSAFQGGDWGYGALAELVGAGNAEWIVGKVASIIPAFDELWAAINGIDWGSGGLQDLVGEEAATWILDTIDRIRESFVSFKDSVVDTGQQIVDALAPVVEWMGQFFNDQLSATLESLGGALGSVAGAFGSVASAVGGTLWSALQGVVDLFIGLWEFLSPVLMPILKAVAGVVGGALVGAFAGLVGGVRVAAEVIELLANGARWLIDHSVVPLVGAIGGLIDWFREGSAAADVVKGVLVGLGSAIGVALLPILGMLVGQWVLTGVQAVASAGRQVAAWAMTGGAAVKNGLLSVGALARTAAGWVAAGVQSTLGAAKMAAAWVVGLGPIGWAIGAIVGIGAALVAFFTKTETGRELWSKFTGAIATAWDWVVEKFQAGVQWVQDAWSALTGALQSAWTGVIQPVLNGIWNLVKTTLAVIGTVVLAPLLIAWELLSSGIQWWWENVTKPALDAMGKFFMDTLWPAVQSVADWISDKWSWLSEKLSAGWSWIQSNVIDPFVDGLQWLWDKALEVIDWIVEKWQWLGDMLGAGWSWIDSNVIQPVILAFQRVWDTVLMVVDWIVGKWNWLADMLAAGWSWIDQNVIAVFIRGLDNLWQAFLAVGDWISDKWSWLGDQLAAGWRWIDENVFAPLGRGLETVQDWFQAAVDGIGKIWDGLKAAAAKPVRFVVDTVWNNGILAAWNAIAAFLPGIDTKEPVPLGELGRYATGGVLPGYTPGRDVHDFYSPTGGRIHLSGGEAIMRPEWTQAVGGPAAVERMNKAARAGKLDQEQIRIGQAHGFLGAFASGGVIGAMMNIVRAKYGNILTMTSGYRPGHGPYHGTQQATDWSNGGGNTPEQLALAHDIRQTYPGAAQLIYDSPGWAGNIYEGSPAGAMDSGTYKTAQAGPHHHHVHWAMTTPPTMQFGGGVFEGGNNGGGPGAAVFNWIADRARGVWDQIVAPIKNQIPSVDSDFARIPGAALEELASKAWGFISGLFGAGGGSNSGSVDTSNVPADVVGAVETVFARHGFTGQQWEDAKWIIQQESNWNPTAQNPSSGAYGLFQFNPMGGNTLAAYLPDRNPDPAVQADAGARYMKDRYGDPTSARRFWEQNQWYADGGVVDLFDQGGLAVGTGYMRKDIIKPERVLPPSTTAALDRALMHLPAMTGDMRVTSESLKAVAGELRLASQGSDGGYAELARYVGGGNALLLTSILAGDLTGAMDGVAVAAVDLGNSLAGPFIDSTDEVQAALQRLDEARSKATDQSDQVTEAEEALAEARKELREAEEGSSEQSLSIARKLEDAEAAVAEARALTVDPSKDASDQDKQRADNAEKLAAAQKKLARAEEDAAAETIKNEKSQAEAIKKAREKVTKAEEGVADAHDEVTASADEVIAAEKALAASRIRAASQVAQSIGNGLIDVMTGVASFADTMAGFAAEMQGTEDQLRSLRVESATSEINRLRSLAAFRQAEKDLETVRKAGAETTMKIGDTSVAAMGRALETFRETGVLSVEVITESVMDGAQNAGDATEEARQATLNMQSAAVDYMIASINASKVTQMQEILTRQLHAQQSALYGLSGMQYTAMSMFMQGVVKIISGIVKIGAAIAAGISIVATGGALAIPAGIAAIAAGISGIGDLMQGGVMVKENWEGFREGWNEMDVEGQIMVVGAGLSSAGTAAGNAFGAAYPSMGIPQGDPQAPWDSLNAMMEMRWDATNKVFEDEISDLNEKTQDQLDVLNIIKDAISVMGETTDEDILEALDIDRLLDRLEQGPVTTTVVEPVALDDSSTGRLQSIVEAAQSVDAKIDEPTVLNVQLVGASASMDDVEQLVYELARQVGDIDARVERIGKPSARDGVLATR